MIRGLVLLAVFVGAPALAASNRGKEPPPEVLGGDPESVPGFVVPSYHGLPPTIVAAMRQRLLDKMRALPQPETHAEDPAATDHADGH